MLWIFWLVPISLIGLMLYVAVTFYGLYLRLYDGNKRDAFLNAVLVAVTFFILPVWMMEYEFDSREKHRRKMNEVGGRYGLSKSSGRGYQ